MTKLYAVTFDIANGTFDYYTQEMWNNQVQSWRDELFDSGTIEDRDIVEEMHECEILECMWGDEVFMEFIPEDVK